jgi:hypothetical protein
MTPHTVDPRFAFGIRVIATIIVAGIILAVGLRATVPSGRLRSVSGFLAPTPLLSLVKPSERVVGPETKDGTGVTVVASPVYMDLAAPDAFDRVIVSLRYRNAGQPVVEIGALGSSLDNTFLMRPAESRLLDALAWPRVSSGTLTLLQRDPNYVSVDAFLEHPPSPEVLATYRAEAAVPYRMPGYVPSSVVTSTDVSLRGSHRMLVYAERETLQLTFSVQDMNRHDGADPVTVSVYRMGDSENALARTVLADDGDVSDDQKSEGLRTVAVTLTDPASGAYRVDLTASDDVFIRSIHTPQQKLVFDGHLTLGDHVGYSDHTDPVTVITDGTRASAWTSHAESFQTLTMDGKPYPLDAIRTPAHAALDGVRQRHAIVSPKRDVVIDTDGVLALSEAQYFDPLPFALQWYTDEAALDAAGIRYVLTSYEPPVRDGDSLIATAEFPTSALATTDDGAYRLVISVPGLEENASALHLESLSAILRRPPSSLADAFLRLFAGPRRPPIRAGIANVVPDGESFGELIP